MLSVLKDYLLLHRMQYIKIKTVTILYEILQIANNFRFILNRFSDLIFSDYHLNSYMNLRDSPKGEHLVLSLAIT
jgi:hypothetical protein